MDAIMILKRCREAPQDMRRMAERIRQRREALTSLHPPQADPNGGGRSTGDGDKTLKLLGDIDTMERALEMRRQAEAVEITAACVLLDELPELESKVLHAYYVKREDTPLIAMRMGYQASTVRKAKMNGEKTLETIPEERVRAALPPWYLKTYGGGTR